MNEVQTEAAIKKPKLGERLKELIAKYGTIAIVLHVVIFCVVMAGFAVAIAAGFDVKGGEGATGLLGVLGAAWVAAKLTSPIRILVTLALTPLVAAALDWFKGKKEVR